MTRYRQTTADRSLADRSKGLILGHALAICTATIFAGGAVGCATTSTRSTTWTAEAPAPQPWARYGRVSWVREIVQRQEGNPAGGAVAGAIIGGLLGGGRGPGALVGAAGGAAIGAASSQGSTESRRYEVMVGFADGAYQVFVYNGGSPFRPGQPVVQTAQGLSPY
jgi:outer membrane lipoprotein SlyB